MVQIQESFILVRNVKHFKYHYHHLQVIIIYQLVK